VLDRPIEKLPRHFPHLSGVKLLYGSGQMWVYRLNTSSPRVYVASHVIPVESEVVLDQEELPEFDRTTEALIDEESAESLKGNYTQQTEASPGQAKIVSYGRNAVTIDVTTDHSGVLVLHDIFYPGWEVSVDGERRPLLRANLLFRGVEVGAGHHRVDFKFDPLSFDNLLAAAAEVVAGEGEETQSMTLSQAH
jgi:hypothetical protein